MESPQPSPRLRELKKPIPTPRRSIVKSNLENIAETNTTDENTNNLSTIFDNNFNPFNNIQQVDDNKLQNSSTVSEEHHTNSLTKRVSSASKQLADKKRAVIEGTRQSVRRLARRFSSSSQEQSAPEESEIPSKGEEDSISLFSSITFSSPLSRSENIYNNADSDSQTSSSEENLVGLPPPKHPPPPPPDESLYDEPISLSSSSNSGNSANSRIKTENYESVFPVFIPPTTQTSNNKEQIKFLSRSHSWKFYDIVAAKDSLSSSINSVNEKDEVSSEPAVKGISIDLNFNIERPPSVVSSIARSQSFKSTAYENHDILPQPPARPPRPSKSVILQFDPLNVSEKDNAQGQNDIKLLEELLQGDLYGNLSNTHTFDEWSISNDSEPEDVISPPTPPIRVDSLPEDEQETDKAIPKSRTNWFTDYSVSRQNSVLENKKPSWFKQVKDVLEKAPEVVRGIKSKDNIIERAAIAVNKITQKKGMLYKVQNGPVEDLFGEYSGRWCILENSSLLCYSDNTCQNLKEHFSAQNILSVQLLQDKKYNYRYDNDDLYCFELNTTGKTRGGHIYGSRSISERRIWIQLISESLTSRFSSKLTTNISRMGWAYVREGVSGKWVGAWIILSQREFCYAIDGQPVKTMDLRKARCIILQPYQDSDNNPRTNDKGPNMLIDCPNLVLYLRMWTSRETKVWCHIVKLEAHNNGANLDQQQLTKNDVPVIVEKCINFIYAHGSMTEGIYRRPGQGSAISELLSKFRKDAFAVQLTSDTCNEHEVATALKRFFRDLPEPLLGSNQRQYLYEVSKHNNSEERIRMYKASLDQLPSISYNTSRKLIGHLHFISTQSAKNLMTTENLASIWGPTLLHYEDRDPIPNVNHNLQLDTEVVNQLIKSYRYIFPEDPGELEKEKHMLKVLEKYSKAPQGNVYNKTAGDLRIWVYLHNKEGQSYNVAVGPNKTAYDICKELCDHMKLGVHELIVEEIILNDKLIRPIHYQEKILDVVLKWGYWDEQDRKDNYLTLAPLSKYWEFILEKPYPVSGEMRFADSKTRLFKLLTFQFSQGKLTCFKDKTGEIILHSWNIEDIVWYIGHESKRTTSSRWTITFLDANTYPLRTKNSPFFGSVLVWNDAATRANWLSAMLKSRYPNNLAPPPNLLPI